MTHAALSLWISNVRMQVLVRILVLMVSVVVGHAAHAQAVSATTFGTPGLIEMPSAQSAPDAELSTSVSYFDGTQRTTLSFQITPRLSGSFRYSILEDYLPSGTLYDRSFDLRYRVLDESRYRPSVAIGLQDFIGNCCQITTFKFRNYYR